MDIDPHRRRSRLQRKSFLVEHFTADLRYSRTWKPRHSGQLLTLILWCSLGFTGDYAWNPHRILSGMGVYKPVWEDPPSVLTTSNSLTARLSNHVFSEPAARFWVWVLELAPLEEKKSIQKRQIGTVHKVWTWCCWTLVLSCPFHGVPNWGFVFAVSAALLCRPLLVALGQPADVAYTSARYAQAQCRGDQHGLAMACSRRGTMWYLPKLLTY